MNTHTHAWTTMNIHGRPWALERSWAPMNSHELVFFQIQCSWQITCWTICLTVFEFLFWVVGYASFWFDCFFLELNIISIFMFYVFLFCPVVASCPKKILADFCKTWFLINIYVYSHSFIYSNINMYIYIDVMLCIFIYSIISIYIYIYARVFVCVGGAASKWGVLFSSQRTLFGTKKGQTYPCIYNIYIYIDRCFFFISCVGLSHPKYMFSGFLLYVVFQHHFIGKNVSNQKVFHWRLQYR